MSRVKRGIIGLFLLPFVAIAYLLSHLLWFWPRRAWFYLKHRKVIRSVEATTGRDVLDFLKFVESTREALKKHQRETAALADVDFDSDAGRLLVFNQCIKHVQAQRGEFTP